MAPGGEVDEEIVIKFAQKLAGNEKKYRDRALKKLKKWMRTRCQTGNGFTEEEMMKIWKGLHYCMWMADKPLVQEDLAESLCELIHCFGDVDMSLLFVDVFFKTAAREWFGIDRLRLDKFMMLIRRFLHQTFTLVAQQDWNREVMDKLVAILQKGVISGRSDDVPEGLKYHIIDIYFDELQKTGADVLSEDEVQVFVDPYCVLLAETKSQSLSQHAEKYIFDGIIQRLYEEADEDQEEEDGEEEEEKEPKLQFDYQCIAERLFELASSKKCSSRQRSRIYPLVKKFQDLAKGVLPEEEILTSGSEDSLTENDIHGAMQRLERFENKLMAKTGKSKKKRKKMEDQEGIEDAEPKMKKQKVAGGEKAEKKSKTKNKFKGQGQVKVESTATGASPTGLEKQPKNKKKKKKMNLENADVGDDGEVHTELNSKQVNVETPDERKNKMDDKKSKKKQKEKMSAFQVVQQGLGVKSNDEAPLFGGGFDDADDVGIDSSEATLSQDVAVQNQNGSKKKRASLGTNMLSASMTPGGSTKKQKAKRASLGSVPHTDSAAIFKGGSINDDEVETTPQSAQSASKKKRASLTIDMRELQPSDSLATGSSKKKKVPTATLR